MEFVTPNSLRAEHAELHVELGAAAKLQGLVGDAARTVARLLHPHFIKEEEFALPPLGLLPTLMHGDVTEEMFQVTTITDRLKSEMPVMLAEHHAIVDALRQLERAALACHDTARVHLAKKIINHTQAEEEVMYPAAVLVGEYLKARWQDGRIAHTRESYSTSDG